MIRSQKITVPVSSKAFRIDIRDGQPDLWLEYCCTDEPATERIFELYSDDERVASEGNELQFIDSFEISDPNFSPGKMKFNCFEYRPDRTNTVETCQDLENDAIEHRLICYNLVNPTT